jgi:hypothetical protein
MHIEILAALVCILRNPCGLWHCLDSAGPTSERTVSLTAWEESEILLVDLGVELPVL